MFFLFLIPFFSSILLLQIMTPKMFISWIDNALEHAKEVLALASGKPKLEGSDSAAVQRSKIHDKLSELMESKGSKPEGTGAIMQVNVPVAISSMSWKRLELAASERLEKELRDSSSGLAQAQDLFNDIGQSLNQPE